MVLKLKSNQIKQIYITVVSLYDWLIYRIMAISNVKTDINLISQRVR